jgi:hypothetical protein
MTPLFTGGAFSGDVPILLNRLLRVLEIFLRFERVVFRSITLSGHKGISANDCSISLGPYLAVSMREDPLNFILQAILQLYRRRWGLYTAI